MTARAALLPLLLLAACGREPVEPAPVRPAPAAVEAAVQTGWQPVSGPTGHALVLFDADSRPVLSLVCRPSPARLEVVAERFTAVGSEERLTLGAAGEAFALVADPTAPRPAGVIARGDVDARLLDHLARTDEIGLSYGAQTFTHAAPPRPVLQAFAAACRSVGR